MTAFLPRPALRMLAAGLAPVLALALILATGRPALADWSIDALMASLAAVPSVDAVFHERKEMAVLATPLEMSGILRYRAPNELQKEVLYPEPVRYAIEADRVVIDQPGGRREEFALDQYPLLRELTESLRATLAGDLPSLERYYLVRLAGEPTGWELRLEPIDPIIARRITAILIRGSGQAVVGVETLESNGDRSVMTITSPSG
jgi:hypothetical protein